MLKVVDTHNWIVYKLKIVKYIKVYNVYETILYA